jgi:glucokinase
LIDSEGELKMVKDKLIGVDLGGTTIKFAILTADGDIQQKWSIRTNILEEGAHIVPDIVESINHHLDLYQLDRDRIIGIGMGTPGTVDIENGTVQGAFNLNWKDLQTVRKDIETATGLPLTLDNDANAAALGEQWRGAGNNDPEVSFITLGTGVGGGLINDGKLVHGTNGAAGEVGHMIVEPHGYLCTCGNYGCLEQYASATGVVHLAQDFAEAYVGNSKLKAMINNGEEVTSKIVFDLAKENDYLANEVVDKVAYYLGLASANLANILNPSSIVIGGGVSAAGKFLLERVEKNFKEFAFKTTRDVTQVKLAELGNDAGVYGAASLAKNSARALA